MRCSLGTLARLAFLATLAFVMLGPASASARPCSTDTETVTADSDDGVSSDDQAGGEVSNDTAPALFCVEVYGRAGGAGGDAGDAGGVNRIDAGAGATAAMNTASTVPWLLAAAGVTGSILRRRRR
jgi:hypothetical protein